MQGRVENKLKTEQRILNMIQGKPDYIIKFYYSINNKTHSTKLRYVTNAVRFSTFCEKSNKPINEVDELDIKRYIEEINLEYISSHSGQRELAPSTIANIYSSLGTFMNFLVKHNYIQKNPFAERGIERPRVRENDVVFLTPEEVKSTEELILSGTEIRDFRWIYRDYLLFRIPVVNGLRVTALSEINIQDIDYREHSIRVTEKGNITKDVFLDEKTFGYLIKWLDQRKKLIRQWHSASNAMFISDRGDRMCVATIEKTIKKYTKIAVPHKHITPHKLRSTCGTNLYQAKKDIYLVAKVLGHQSTAPTQRYTKVFDADKRDAINTIAELYD